MADEPKNEPAPKAEPKVDPPPTGDRRAEDYATHGEAAPWIPKGRLDEEIRKRREAQERLDKELAPLADRASKAEADLAAVRAAHAFDVAAVRVLSDDEDIAEFRDRYNRLPPGEDGKKPSPKEWFADLLKRHAEGKAPKWAIAYLPPVKVADPDGEEDEPAPPPKKKAQPREEEPDPNAGTRQADGGGSRAWTPERLDRVGPDVVRANHGKIVADLEKAGMVRAPTSWLARRGVKQA